MSEKKLSIRAALVQDLWLIGGQEILGVEHVSPFHWHPLQDLLVPQHAIIEALEIWLRQIVLPHF